MVVEPIRKPIGVRIPLNHASVGGADGIRVAGDRLAGDVVEHLESSSVWRLRVGLRHNAFPTADSATGTGRRLGGRVVLRRDKRCTACGRIAFGGDGPAVERHAEIFDPDDGIDPATSGTRHLVAQEREGDAVRLILRRTGKHSTTVRRRVALTNE